MQILPSVPTDNIYKFYAISGLWLVAGFLFFICWSVYFNMQLKIETRHTQAYYFSLNTERDIAKRIEALQQGRVNDARLSWMPLKMPPKDELNLLLVAQKNHQETIKKYKDEAEKSDHEYFSAFEITPLTISLLVLYVSAMVGCFWYGFSRWHSKIQKPIEDTYQDEKKIRDNAISLYNLEEQIKQKTLDKLNEEISALSAQRAGYQIDLDIKVASLKKLKAEIKALTEQSTEGATQPASTHAATPTIAA